MLDVGSYLTFAARLELTSVSSELLETAGKPRVSSSQLGPQPDIYIQTYIVY